ncbi:MAG: hypothetical protein QMD12_03295 [Candidatus Aenigmarchaeota archaeon]|nr:hypothetical protein [Candidatus Aenigmarchaeota archaeon]
MPIFGRKAEVRRGFVPVDKVRALISNNVPEGEIIEILRREGFSAEEIDQAFAEVFKPLPPAPAQIPTPIQTPTPAPLPEPEKPKEEVKEEKPAFAPLFVKLDKYRQILMLLSELKTTLVAIKNNFTVLNEIEKIEEENIKLLQKAIEKVDKKIVSLDTQLLRPPVFEEELPTEAEELGDVLSSLKSEVEQLKSELQNIA